MRTVELNVVAYTCAEPASGPVFLGGELLGTLLQSPYDRTWWGTLDPNRCIPSTTGYHGLRDSCVLAMIDMLERFGPEASA